VAKSPFDWAAPAPAKSFDDMPIPTAAKLCQPIGFSQIAQRSKSSSICFGGQPVFIASHLCEIETQWGSKYQTCPVFECLILERTQHLIT
jgi:hypothetical protein